MIQKPMDVLDSFPIRKSKKQKQAFRDAVQSYARSIGYRCNVEKGSFGSHNVVLGDPDQAKFLITAHYDTCAHLPFPNLITPCNFWAFLAYQLFVTAVMLLPPVALGILVGAVTQSFDAGYFVGYFAFLGMFLLMMFGPANKNNANDNTSGVVTLLEIAAALPQQLRDKVCFVLFDLEEAGLVGSSSYRVKHKKATASQVVLNLDCVGDGDHLLLVPTGKLKKNKEAMAFFKKHCAGYGAKTVALRDRGFSVYPSDQANFPYGMGICALHSSKAGLYMSRIHTNRDTILEKENVNILRDTLIAMIADAAEG